MISEGQDEIAGEVSGLLASPGLGRQQPGVAMEPCRASARRGGPGAQLFAVVGILAVVSTQVVAEAESGSLVTLTGLPLASRSTS